MAQHLASELGMTCEEALDFCLRKQGYQTGQAALEPPFESPLGRLELLAHYGPLDAQGRLRGGRCGARPLTDMEMHRMAQELHAARWRRLLDRDHVDELVPHTLGVDPKSGRSLYGRADLQRFLAKVMDNSSDRRLFLSGASCAGFEAKVGFARLQDQVVRNVDARFQAAHKVLKQGGCLSAEGMRQAWEAATALPSQTLRAQILRIADEHQPYVLVSEATAIANGEALPTVSYTSGLLSTAPLRVRRSASATRSPATDRSPARSPATTPATRSPTMSRRSSASSAGRLSSAAEPPGSLADTARQTLHEALLAASQTRPASQKPSHAASAAGLSPLALPRPLLQRLSEMAGQAGAEAPAAAKVPENAGARQSLVTANVKVQCSVSFWEQPAKDLSRKGSRTSLPPLETPPAGLTREQAKIAMSH